MYTEKKEFLFDKLDILYLPMDKSNIVDDEYRKFLNDFRELFAQFEDSEQNPEFALFYKNFNPNQFKFLNICSKINSRRNDFLPPAI